MQKIWFCTFLFWNVSIRNRINKHVHIYKCILLFNIWFLLMLIFCFGLCLFIWTLFKNDLPKILAKFWFSSYGPKCNILRKRWIMKFPYLRNISWKRWVMQLTSCLQINTKVFYKLILSLWVFNQACSKYPK